MVQSYTKIQTLANNQVVKIILSVLFYSLKFITRYILWTYLLLEI